MGGGLAQHGAMSEANGIAFALGYGGSCGECCHEQKVGNAIHFCIRLETKLWNGLSSDSQAAQGNRLQSVRTANVRFTVGTYHTHRAG